MIEKNTSQYTTGIIDAVKSFISSSLLPGSGRRRRAYSTYEIAPRPVMLVSVSIEFNFQWT